MLSPSEFSLSLYLDRLDLVHFKIFIFFILSNPACGSLTGTSLSAPGITNVCEGYQTVMESTL